MRNFFYGPRAIKDTHARGCICAAAVLYYTTLQTVNHIVRETRRCRLSYNRYNSHVFRKLYDVYARILVYTLFARAAKLFLDYFQYFFFSRSSLLICLLFSGGKSFVIERI